MEQVGTIRRGQSWLVALLLVLVILLPVAFATRGLSTDFAFRRSNDEYVHHIKIINQFVEEWPNLDLVNYRAAMAPGYHILMAGLARIAGLGHSEMRLATLTITILSCLAFFGLCFHVLLLDRWLSCSVTALYTLSAGTFQSAYPLTTDNLGMLFLLGSLAFFYRALEHSSLLDLFLGLACGTFASLVRQTYVVLILVGLVVLLRMKLPVVKTICLSVPAALFALPIAVLFYMWGGLVPPHAQTRHTSGFEPNAWAILVALMILGLYASILAPGYLVERRSTKRLLGTVGAIALFSLLFAWTPLAKDDPGRGLILHSWIVDRVNPFPLVLMGTLLVAALAGRVDVLGLPSLLALLLTLTQVPNREISQRYYDPLLLVVLTLWIGRGIPRDRVKVPIIAAACLAIAISYATVFKPFTSGTYRHTNAVQASNSAD